jgi:hypothetical protein
MGIPRPDTNNVKQILETETGYEWAVNIDQPDKLSFASGPFSLEITWDGSYWTFNLYDLASSYGEEEPRWQQGPMQNATEIKNELPEFIPVEIRHTS